MPRRERFVLFCVQCDSAYEVIRSRVSKSCYCSIACRNEHQRITALAEGNPAWRGGRIIDPRTGYAYIRIGRRKYRLEHRLVVEHTLGRALDRSECVHHINRDKSDNRPENLAVMTQAEHVRHHPLTTWAKRGVTQCSQCNRTDRPHKSQGLCSFCYESQRSKRRSWKKENYGKRIA